MTLLENKNIIFSNPLSEESRHSRDTSERKNRGEGIAHAFSYWGYRTTHTYNNKNCNTWSEVSISSLIHSSEAHFFVSKRS